MEEANIIGLYERHADAWARARPRMLNQFEQAWLDRFTALLPPAAAVLDCGCGTGEPIARTLADRGCAITGIDASASLVRMFQKNLPQQRAVVADMRTLALGTHFHGILAWDSFFHLSRDAQRSMFTVFRRHAAPAAMLLFTSGSEEGEALGQFQGEPLFHASLSPAEYRQRLAEHGFSVVAHVEGNDEYGSRTVWLAQFAESPA
jgi:2-polyprenyl-3-methyl-5-hydroxy-6-metoxy-1,4-benzoquinol methylase